MQVGFRNTQSSSFNQAEPTRFAVPRPSGRSVIVRPGEPHHFDNRVDHQSGKVICTLCRCHDPDAHGDAYTMLDSPRGCDISGNAIDWQRAKIAMLDFYGKEQISHEEEIIAIPFVYEASWASQFLKHERDMANHVRDGGVVEVNIEDNNMSWHNEDGHAKQEVTERGARTKIDRSYGNSSSYRQGNTGD